MTDASNDGARAFYRGMGFAESDDKIVYRADASTNFGRA